MKVSVGQVFVFKGSNSRVEHFSNFKIGESYVVSHITTHYTDEAVYGPEQNIVVLFRDFDYGVYLYEMDTCFDTLQDLRDDKISFLEL